MLVRENRSKGAAAVLVIAAAFVALGCDLLKGTDATGAAPTNTGTNSCMTATDTISNASKSICCSAPGETATYASACGHHLIVGCEGESNCTLYTDDSLVTLDCDGQLTCEQCISQGDADLESWCELHQQNGD